jgi:hypothetical protein
MHRSWLLLAVVPLTTLAAGCCMCDAPYDYCGPTFLARPGEECCSDVRMNSAFTPYPAYVDVPVEGMIEGVAPAVPGEASPSDAPPNPAHAMPPDGTQPNVGPGVPSVNSPAPAESESTTAAPRNRPVSLRR